MTFKEWILRHVNRNDSLGALASYVASDSSFPEGVGRKETIAILEDKGFSDNFIASVSKAWKTYEKFCLINDLAIE